MGFSDVFVIFGVNIDYFNFLERSILGRENRNDLGSIGWGVLVYVSGFVFFRVIFSFKRNFDLVKFYVLYNFVENFFGFFICGYLKCIDICVFFLSFL